jgi:hypothetical protein
MDDLARSLRARLAERQPDLPSIAADARTVFEAAGWTPHVRWLQLELGGYGPSTDASRVHDLLGLEVADPLATLVRAYRTREGVVDGGAAPSTIHHFFVESLPNLRAASDKIIVRGARMRLELPRAVGASPLIATFATSATCATFATDVYDRVLLGFRAVLDRQLEALTR